MPLDIRPLFEDSKNLFNQSRTIQTLLGEECDTEQATLNEFQGARGDYSAGASDVQQLPANPGRKMKHNVPELLTDTQRAHLKGLKQSEHLHRKQISQFPSSRNYPGNKENLKKHVKQTTGGILFGTGATMATPQSATSKARFDFHSLDALDREERLAKQRSSRVVSQAHIDTSAHQTSENLS